MLIILSCLVITGGELLALGELAEDQVQEIHGDLGVEISAKTWGAGEHRKTHGNMGKTWGKPW